MNAKHLASMLFTIGIAAGSLIYAAYMLATDRSPNYAACVLVWYFSLRMLTTYFWGITLTPADLSQLRIRNRSKVLGNFMTYLVSNLLTCLTIIFPNKDPTGIWLPYSPFTRTERVFLHRSPTYGLHAWTIQLPCQLMAEVRQQRPSVESDV